MMQKTQQSIEASLQQQRKSFSGVNKKQKVSKKILLGSIVATLISITPYLYYLYESVPDTKIWDTFLFTYDSKNFEEASTVMWLFAGKAVPLLLMFIWFFTNRHWWYHVLLVPITMYVFQIIDIFNSDLSYVDEVQLKHLIPVMAIIIPSIYLIRAQMFNKVNDADKTMEELEEEFMIKPKSLWGKISQYF